MPMSNLGQPGLQMVQEPEQDLDGSSWLGLPVLELAKLVPGAVLGIVDLVGPQFAPKEVLGVELCRCIGHTVVAEEAVATVAAELFVLERDAASDTLETESFASLLAMQGQLAFHNSC